MDDGTAWDVWTEIGHVGEEGGGVVGPGAYIDGIDVWIAGVEIAGCLVDVRDPVGGTGVIHFECSVGVDA